MNVQNPPRSGGNGAEPRGRKPRRTPKGRQIDPQAADEIAALLGDRSRQRDLLIEHLHLIQDKYGHISSAHLTALAAEMKLSQTEVYEVATFYAHFDVVKEGETPPPPVTVRVCDSLSCAMAGADRLLKDLPKTLGPDVRVVRAPCMGACDHAPVCAVGHVQVMKATRCVGEEHRLSDDARARAPARHRLRALHGGRRLSPPRRGVHRQAHARRADQDRQRRRPARPRRRGLSDRPQVVAGARRAWPAPDGGERRRGRARHLQGPLLSRPRSAPLPRRHAARRLGGRGGRGLHLHPRRISRASPDAARRDRQARARRPRPSSPRSICAAAPAPTSAAKNRR